MGTGDRVIGYARVSTAEQGASGAGLDAQRAAIEGPVGSHHPIAEPRANRSQSGRADINHLARQLVGVDDEGSKLPEPLRHGRFASTHPASESHAQHVGSLLPDPARARPTEAQASISLCHHFVTFEYVLRNEPPLR